MDGIYYTLWVPEEEIYLEEIVKEHAKEIFTEDSLFFDSKKRISSESGVISKPDGYLIDFIDNNWGIVEVELSKHDLHKHIVAQLAAFITGIEDSRNEIVKTLYSDIKSDSLREAFVKERLGSKDIHQFLTGLVSEDPRVIIIIEESNKQVEDACKSLKIEPEIVELKTFIRSGVGMEYAHKHAHIHLINNPWNWEFFDAIYDKERKVFLCNEDECHKNNLTFKVGEINEHLMLAHGIPPDEQDIEGWTDDFENQFRLYLARKYLKTKK